MSLFTFLTVYTTFYYSCTTFPANTPYESVKLKFCDDQTVTYQTSEGNLGANVVADCTGDPYVTITPVLKSSSTCFACNQQSYTLTNKGLSFQDQISITQSEITTNCQCSEGNSVTISYYFPSGFTLYYQKNSDEYQELLYNYYTLKDASTFTVNIGYKVTDSSNACYTDGTSIISLTSFSADQCGKSVDYGYSDLPQICLPYSINLKNELSSPLELYYSTDRETHQPVASTKSVGNSMAFDIDIYVRQQNSDQAPCYSSDGFHFLESIRVESHNVQKTYSGTPGVCQPFSLTIKDNIPNPDQKYSLYYQKSTETDKHKFGEAPSYYTVLLYGESQFSVDIYLESKNDKSNCYQNPTKVDTIVVNTFSMTREYTDNSDILKKCFPYSITINNQMSETYSLYYYSNNNYIQITDPIAQEYEFTLTVYVKSTDSTSLCYSNYEEFENIIVDGTKVKEYSEDPAICLSYHIKLYDYIFTSHDEFKVYYSKSKDPPYEPICRQFGNSYTCNTIVGGKNPFTLYLYVINSKPSQQCSEYTKLDEINVNTISTSTTPDSKVIDSLPYKCYPYSTTITVPTSNDHSYYYQFQGQNNYNFILSGTPLTLQEFNSFTVEIYITNAKCSTYTKVTEFNIDSADKSLEVLESQIPSACKSTEDNNNNNNDNNNNNNDNNNNDYIILGVVLGVVVVIAVIIIVIVIYIRKKKAASTDGPKV